MREKENWLRRVPDFTLDEERLVVLDKRDDIPARYVAMVDDGIAVLIEVQVSGGDAPARDSRADGAAVKHSGKDNIIDVLGRARDFFGAILSRDITTNRG